MSRLTFVNDFTNIPSFLDGFACGCYLGIRRSEVKFEIEIKCANVVPKLRFLIFFFI